ncbi:hypothetical protein [Rhodococcus jostii]|nr:hypothetical protein [Rhodococcus jostii]
MTSGPVADQLILDRAADVGLLAREVTERSLGEPGEIPRLARASR